MKEKEILEQIQRNEKNPFNYNNIPERMENIIKSLTVGIEGKDYMSTDHVKLLLNVVDCAGLTLNQYQEKAMSTCLPSCSNPMYMLFGLTEETGELAGKISKAIRKEIITIEGNGLYRLVGDSSKMDELYEQIKSELGDVLWFVAGIAERFGWTLEEVARYNNEKLANRKKSDTIITHKDH